MPEKESKYVNAAKSRITTIRTRTWTLSLSLVVSLIFYLIVNVSTKQAINWIDFTLLCTMQIIVHSLYFPDGELFGQKDKAFISNKTAYNDKATDINQNKEFAQLRKYCKIEYEERKQRHFLNVIGKIGITEKEYDELSQKSKKEIKELKTFETKEIIDGEEKSRLIVFSKYKKKLLLDLLFEPSPVEENFPETIISAVENDGNKAIKDSSISYKKRSYIRKIFLAVIVGGIFAYIGYTVRDGFGWVEIVSICMYLTTLLTTAVTAFTSGETCSKVYKSHFYLDLANFIDGFNEWNYSQPKTTNKEDE